MAKSMVEIVIGAKDQFSGVMDKANSRMKSMAGSARKAGLVVSAFGGAGIIAGKSFVDAALVQQKALDVLGNAVEKTGVSFDQVKQDVLDTTAALQQKTNFGDEQQIQALGRLVALSGNYEDSLAALPAVMDTATALGIDFNAATTLIGRGLAGNTEMFTRYGVEIEKGASPLQLITKLTDQFGGAAEANVNPLTQMSNAFGDVKEVIGAALLPLVEPLTGFLTSLAERVQTVNPQLLKIGALVLGVSVALAAVIGPMLLMLGFLPALAGGFAIVGTAIGGLMAVLGILISWPALLVLAFGALAVALIRNWGGVRDKVGDAINGILKVFSVMINKAIEGLNELIKFANKIPGLSIPAIGEVNLSLQGIGKAGGDAFGFVAEKIGGFAGKAKNLMKSLPGQVVPSIDKIIGKFNDLTGENLPAMSKVIDKVKGKMTGLTEAVAGTGASAAPAQRAKEEAVVAGEAAEKSWDKAKTAHELYQQALTRKKASTNIQMSQHELALRQMAIYNRRVADERAGTAEAGAVYGGTGERIEGGWTTVMDRLTGGRSSDPFASLPITLHIGSEEVQGSLENLLGKAAERLEASGGA